MRRVALPTLVLFTAGWFWFSVMALVGARAAEPGAMTVGCSQGTCCTSRCYLDSNGNHHCVPKEGHSCECGLSQEKDSGALPTFVAITLQTIDALQTYNSSTRATPPSPILPQQTDLRIPTPPPRFCLPA